LSIEEEDIEKITEGNNEEVVTIASIGGLSEERVFINSFAQGPNKALAKPFGTINWTLLVPLAAFTAAAIFFFERVLDLGKVNLDWTITFDVDLVAGLLVVLGLAISIGPKAIKTPRLLAKQNTRTTVVLLGLVAFFFFFKLVDFGTFKYILDKIDLNNVLGIVFIALICAMALRGSKLSIVALVCFFLWWGFSVRVSGFGANAQNFGFSTVVDLFTSERGAALIGRFVPPKWQNFANAIDPLFLTVQTAVASTVIGAIVALPVSVLAAKNTSPHPAIYNIVRLITNTIRSIPSLIMALLFIPFVGLGPAAGILGLGIHAISVLTKLYSEAFESVKPQPIEAMSAVGANGLKSFRWGVFPQAFPLVASYSIFTFESNTRDSTVVAFVGGGGLGFLLQSSINLLDYAYVSMLVIMLIVAVTIMDRFSAFIRGKII